MLLALLVTYVLTASAASNFYLGKQGDDCYKTCLAQGKNCNAHIPTGNSASPFQPFVNCQADPSPWAQEYQPAYLALSKTCVGYTQVPDGVICGAKNPSASRLCYCDDAADSSAVASFGTGLSAGYVDTTEQTIFAWVLNPNAKNGVMTHFWATAMRGVLEGVTVRYYIDGETTASIQFIVPLGSGTGFGDEHAPWANTWIGKGAADGSWWNNFRIPFQKSVVVTVQHESSSYGGFYMIVRGTPNLPIVIGGISVPPTARMNLATFSKSVQPLEWVPVADVPTGSGLFFLQTFAVQSNNLNFLEGCYHQYSPYNQAFPGTVISTGTEDYFDSGWYFNAGQFQAPVAGLTHSFVNSTVAQISAYRFHETDPLPFDKGFKLMWRNGDTVDAAGRKCYTNQGGKTVGSPGISQVTILGWYYTW